MWVRAEGRLDGRKRVVVARVRVAREQLPLPANSAFVAGSVETSNSGNKVIVTGGGIVRCPNGPNGADPPSQKDNDCEGFDPAQVVGAVTPDTDTPANIVSVRGARVAPIDGQVEGHLLRERMSGQPVRRGRVRRERRLQVQLGHGRQQRAKPGMFIVNNGTVQVQRQRHLVRRHLRRQCAELQRGRRGGERQLGHPRRHLRGWRGRSTVGQSKNNLTYDQDVAQTRYVYGTAGIIQNTWRELIAG